VFKVNPPLRTDADVAAVRDGLADGAIDCIATDHAPHTQEAKEAAPKEHAEESCGPHLVLRQQVETEGQGKDQEPEAGPQHGANEDWKVRVPDQTAARGAPGQRAARR